MLPAQDLYNYLKRFTRVSLMIIGWALLIIFGRAAVGQVSDWQQVTGVTERQTVAATSLDSQSTPFFNPKDSKVTTQEFIKERSKHDETDIQVGNTSVSRKKTDQRLYQKQAKANVAALKNTSSPRLN